MRKFEKISYEQFKKDFEDSKELYDKIVLPVRSTLHSAAYDIRSMEEKTLRPGDSVAFKTGLKVCMNDDDVLYIFGRSSLGYKYDVSLTNCVGVIDKDFEVKIGDRIAQGIFMKYLTVDNEEKITNVRTGGLGSTDKGGN